MLVLGRSGQACSGSVAHRTVPGDTGMLPSPPVHGAPAVLDLLVMAMLIPAGDRLRHSRIVTQLQECVVGLEAQEHLGASRVPSEVLSTRELVKRHAVALWTTMKGRETIVSETRPDNWIPYHPRLSRIKIYLVIGPLLSTTKTRT
jgi:hypothetical protein